MLSDFDLEGKNKAQKAAYYLKNYGVSYTAKKALRKLGVPISEESEYMTWCRRVRPSREELKRQSESPLAKRFSFVIVGEPGENTASAGFGKQTCKRISYAKVHKELTIAELLEENAGDYFVLCGASVHVQPEYLYEASGAISGEEKEPESRIRPRNTRSVDIVYTDEDNCVGKKRFRPFFKPDAGIQLLLNFQYMGRLVLLSRSLLERMAENKVSVTLFGNDWYDLLLQAYPYAEHIYHIPKVLFSNQVSETEKNTFVRNVSQGQAKCVEHYLKTENICGSVEASDVPGFYHVEYECKEEPLVSIIIPNKDHAEDLRTCLDSLRKKSDYQNFEVIIAENNSEERETFDFYEELMRGDDRIHVVTWEGSFNYSAINNFAAGSAKGELLLFLNNDTEFMEERTLRELVASTVKPGIGACGAMLYYGDRTIQHASVIIGMGGFAAHGLWSLTDRDERYYPFQLCEREVSAVTGACLMVRREVFDKVKGMGEDFVVALNDVDFCLKIRAAGYGILFNPYARLYHYESKSRGYEDTMEKQARFQSEIERLQKKWETEIKAGDPYYNPNLTLHRADYSMDI